MPQDTWANGSSADLVGLAERRDALRQAAAMPGADPRALLDAAFAELDAAVEVLTKLAEAAAGEPAAAVPADALSAERALLRAVFQYAPVPLFVLEADATIRRANGRAGDLIGAPPGYATGKALTAFVDLPSRAAVKSQLAAAARTGKPRLVECRLIGADGPRTSSRCRTARACSSWPLPARRPAGQPGRGQHAPRTGRPGWSRT